MRFMDISRIRTRFDERVPVSGGAELSVDLYLPAQPGRYPVLLNRTPADNNRSGRSGISAPSAERWKMLAAHGYIVAAADVRGRGDSGGTFVPFVHEAADGAATVAWLRQLDESDGRIGLFGSGYAAFCAWAAAVADGNVDAIVSISPFGAVGAGMFHRQGAVRLDWLFWMHLIGGRAVQPAHVPPWKRIHSHTPLNTMDAALGRDDIWWRQWLDHPDPRDPFWKALDLTEQIQTLKVPGLHITGWWDGQLSAAYYYYEAASRSEAPQRLVIGPWDTAAVRRPLRNVGGIDFGPRSVLDLDETMVGFFGSCFSGPESPYPDSHAVHPGAATTADIARTHISQAFVTGRNEWIVGTGWPLGGEILTLHLSSVLGANTWRGDGKLSLASETHGSKDVITDNPAVPINFQPQFSSFASVAGSDGFTLDQFHVTSRDEALVFTSAAIEQPITVFGCPKVRLLIRTTALDSDIFVLLSDNFPLGTRDLHLSHGVVRLATLRSFRPGELVNVEVELGAVAHDFLCGHQVRLTIAPSLYPLYARNLHVKEYAAGVEPVIGEIEVHSGHGWSSYLTLPLAAEGCRLAVPSIDRLGHVLQSRSHDA